MKKLILLSLFSTLLISQGFAQQTSIQFPRLNFHMNMNQNMKPSVSYRAEANIVVGDESGLIFGFGVAGDDLNLQSGINDLMKLYTLKLSLSPNDKVNFHTFYGRYKYLGEDKVIPRGFQFYYTPGMDCYGYHRISGAGLAVTFPILEGRYEPEFVLYSDNFDGIDYLNLDVISTFRFERWHLELYFGIAAPTIGSVDTTIRGRGGFSFHTSLDYANIYLAVYVPAHFGKEFNFDDIYMRLGQYLLINGFEQTFSITSVGSESYSITDPLVGFNNIPDLNIYASLGGRVRDFGFGVEYSFIYGLYQSDFQVENLNHISNRVGAYMDFKFLTLTYKLGAFYTLPNSPAYYQDNAKPGEVGFYVSVFGAT